jgi:hypothetical protein
MCKTSEFTTTTRIYNYNASAVKGYNNAFQSIEENISVSKRAQLLVALLVIHDRRIGSLMELQNIHPR